MKTIKILPFLFLITPALAQGPQGMSQQDMQKMMEMAQKMQACMAQIDRAEIKELEARSSAMEAEIDALCKAGRRDEAQQKAMAFSKEMVRTPAMQQMKKCGEQVEGMADIMPGMGVEDIEKEFKDKHVCDS